MLDSERSSSPRLSVVDGCTQERATNDTSRVVLLQTPFQSFRCLLWRGRRPILIVLHIPLWQEQFKQIQPATVQSVVAFETRLRRSSNYNQFLTQWTACLVLERIIRIGQWQHNTHCGPKQEQDIYLHIMYKTPHTHHAKQHIKIVM